MDQISFKSSIRAATSGEFYSAASKAGSKNHARHPWTLSESVLAPSAYTRGGEDCNILGFTDGQQVLLMHLDPERKLTPAQVERYIEKRIDLKNPDLQAIIIGGRETALSRNQSDSFTSMIKGRGIPLTELRIAKNKDVLDVAYSSLKDEWIISCERIDNYIRKGIKNSCEIFKNMFKEVKLADCDEFV